MRGLAILEALGRGTTDGLGVTELSEIVDSDKANVHRILAVLRDEGYVQQDVATKRYSMTPRVLELAGRALRRLDVKAVAEPLMNSLRERTGESVHLAMRTSTGAVYVSQARGANVISVETAIGAQPPMHCTATGKALVAHLDDSERVALLGSEPFEAFTSATPTTLEGVRDGLETVRDRGFAVDDEEYNPGVRCVAAPIFGSDGTAIASVGISGPATRMSDERLAELGSLLTETANHVTASLGGERPSRADRATA